MTVYRRLREFSHPLAGAVPGGTREAISAPKVGVTRRLCKRDNNKCYHFLCDEWQCQRQAA